MAILTLPPNIQTFQPIGTANNILHSSSDEMIKLDEIILSASAASITLTPPTSGYTHLKVCFTGSSNYTTGVWNVRIQFNNDTTANYYNEMLYSTGTSEDAVEQLAYNYVTLIDIGYLPPTNYPVSCQIFIPNYLSTIFAKCVITRIVAIYSSLIDGIIGSLYNNTSAINSILLFPSAGDFVAGTVATLYGIID